MTQKPIVIDHGRKNQIATRWNNRAGIGERPRLVAVEWRDKERKGRAVNTLEDHMMEIDEGKPKLKRGGIVQGSLL